MPVGRLHYGQPVNRDHPLNRGLVSEWAVVPWYASGPRWVDLAGRNHGTLTNGPAWVGGNRPGGCGAVSFDGTDDYVNAPVPSGLSGAVAATAAGWAKGLSPTFDEGAPLVTSAAGSENWPYLDTKIYTSVFRSGRVDAIVPGVSLADWYHWCVTTDGTTWRIYFNGVQAASAAAEATVTATTIDMCKDAGGHYWSGHQDDLCVLTRALSASEVAALYDQSRRGNPDRWNWVPDRAYFFGPAGGVTPGVVSPYYYRLLAGGG